MYLIWLAAMGIMTYIVVEPEEYEFKAHKAQIKAAKAAIEYIRNNYQNHKTD